MKRAVKQVHQHEYSPIAGLETYRAMPTRSVSAIDPFLFLNHHGPQVYPANNDGLPFGPHPHRGFETLTYIFKGDIKHRDSGGHESVIKEGGVQWMTAGSGLVHAETSSHEYMQKGGEVEVIQLWLNLPSQLKMTRPAYNGLTAQELTRFSQDDGKVSVHLISGEMGSHKGPHHSITDLTMTYADFKKGGKLNLEVPAENQVLFYVVKGELQVNGSVARTNELVEFYMDGGELAIEATEESRIIFGHGKPFNEPIVAQGPFVMNSSQEIHQAMADYQAGKMGEWAFD